MDDSRRHFDSFSRPDRRGFATSELVEATGFNRRTIAYYVQEGLLPRVGRHGPRTRYPRFVRDRLLFIRRVREAEEAGELAPVSLAELRTAFARLPRRVVAAVADGAIAVSQELVAGEVGALAAPGLFRSATHRQRVLEDRMRDPRVRPDVVEPSGELPGELPGKPPGEPPAPAASALAMPSPAAPAPAVPPPATPAVLEPGVSYSLRPPSAASGDKAAEAGTASGDKAAEARAESADQKAEDRAAKVLGVALAAVSNAARRREEESPQPVDTWMRAEVAPGVELSVRCATEEDRQLLEQAAASLRSLVSKGEAQ